jgi:hypothetical protein
MTYYVAKRNNADEPFKIVYREVKTRTRKGYPLTYELRSLPGEYLTLEEALEATEKLNAGFQTSGYRTDSAGIYPSLP